MRPTHALLAVTLLAAGLHARLLAAPAAPAEAPASATADPDHVRLVAARKAAHDIPEVAAAEQQAKADRALSAKAYADYKTARQRSHDSEAAYRKAFEAALVKVDAGAPGLQEKERAAFRERMAKARAAKKADGSKKSRKDEDPDEEDDAGE